MNKVFENEDFWILYLNLEGNLYDENQNIIKKIKKQDIKNIIEPFSADFHVHHEEGKREYSEERLKEIGLKDWVGKTSDYEINQVYFNFQLKDFQLLIESSFDISGCEHHLYLFYKEEEYLLGWWDLARWHPFCLKYNELQSLLENIKQYDSEWNDSDIPLLLLKNFVGFGKGDEKDFEELNLKAEEIFKELQIECREKLSTCSFREDYSWIKTSLGWEFTADYSCYSLRNSAHKNSKEGEFPFELWNKFIANL